VKDLGDGSLTKLVKKFESLSGKIAQKQDVLGKINTN
jgi:hypothetical protein